MRWWGPTNFWITGYLGWLKMRMSWRYLSFVVSGLLMLTNNREFLHEKIITVYSLYRYDAVNFLQNIKERHPIARPSGQGMGCFLWIQPVIDKLPQLLQWCMQYHGILDHTLDCIEGSVEDFSISIVYANKLQQFLDSYKSAILFDDSVQDCSISST